MIGSAAALLLPTVAVWLWLRALDIRPIGGSRLAGVALAFCVGLGLSSLTTFWWAVAADGLAPAFAGVDGVAWTAIAASAWLWGRGRAPSAPRTRVADGPVRREVWLVRGVFVVLIAIVGAEAWVNYARSPYGHADATLIWNLKARFMVRGGDGWTDFVDVARSNPSHPLLLPASVARLWSYAGADSTAAPAVLGALIGAALLAIVVLALDTRRARAWLAGCVLIAPASFGEALVAQTADLAVGLFLVVISVLLAGFRPVPAPDGRTLLVMGVLAGLMAWTKNEGLLFLGIVLPFAAWRLAQQGALWRLRWLVAGATPALLTVAWLKLMLAPVAPEYFAGAQGVSSLLDPEGYLQLIDLLPQHAIRWGGPAAAGVLPLAIVAAVVVACMDSGRAARGVAAILVLMSFAYCAAWIASPLDLAWLVSETFDRLVIQLWPALVFALFSYGIGAADGQS